MNTDNKITKDDIENRLFDIEQESSIMVREQLFKRLLQDINDDIEILNSISSHRVINRYIELKGLLEKTIDNQEYLIKRNSNNSTSNLIAGLAIVGENFVFPVLLLLLIILGLIKLW